MGIVFPTGPRKPGGGRNPQTPATVGSKRWSAQQGVGWHCPSCKCYNFGFRATCFGCKVVPRPPALGQPATPASWREGPG
eukprot:1420194-Amphidinium_carterae.1